MVPTDSERAALAKERLTMIAGTLCWISTETPVRGFFDKDGYHRFTIGIGIGKSCHYAVHRVVWLLHYGSWPRRHIDHINRDKADNRIENLRDVSRVENMANRPPMPFHKGRGVRWNKDKQRWLATIQIQHRVYRLGSFKNKEDAIAARQAAESRVLKKMGIE